MKELLQHFREQPKEVAMCVMIFAVCFYLQSCRGVPFQRVQRYDSNNRYNGTLKFKKSMFNN